MPGGTKFTWVHCAACGRRMGKRPGVQVVLDIICDDPICQFQDVVSANEQRDSLIVAGVLEGIPVSQIASQAGMSRQRVYQILDTWREGV